MKKKKTVPEFKTIAEEAEFWDTHSFTDYIHEFKKVDCVWDLDKPKSESIILRVQPEIKKSLESVAKNKGLDTSSLARMWIMEKLRSLSA